MDNDVNDAEYITAKEAALMLSRTDRGVRLLAKKGQLEGRNPTGRKWLIRRDSVYKFLGKLVKPTNDADALGEGPDKPLANVGLLSETLLEVAKEWIAQMVFEVRDPSIIRESLLPTHFQPQDGTVGPHQKGPLLWSVGEDGAVELWLPVELYERGKFLALVDRLPAELFERYQAIKSKLAEAIKKARLADNWVPVDGLSGMVLDFTTELDYFLASRA